jgi:hypothetical protein
LFVVAIFFLRDAEPQKCKPLLLASLAATVTLALISIHALVRGRHIFPARCRTAKKQTTGIAGGDG